MQRASVALTGMMTAMVIFSAWIPNTVHAAAGEGMATIAVGTGGTSAYDASYTVNGASGIVTVGTLSYLRLHLAIGASGMAPNEGNATIQINTNLFSAQKFATKAVASLIDINASGEWRVSFVDTDSVTTNNSD